MARLVNIAMAALRFVVALTVGLFLLFVLNIALAIAGVERFHGIIFVAGFGLIVWAAVRIAAPGWLGTFDRAGGPAAAGTTAKFGAVALAALRFVVALAVGFFLLFVLNAMLMFAGVERFRGLIFVPGIGLAVATAIRIAVRGRLSTFERTAGTAAAGVSALIFAGLAFAALSGLSLLAIIWFLAHLGAGPGAFVAINAWFERGTVFVVLMQAGIGASLTAAWLLWWRRNGHSSPRI